MIVDASDVLVRGEAGYAGSSVGREDGSSGTSELRDGTAVPLEANTLGIAAPGNSTGTFSNVSRDDGANGHAVITGSCRATDTPPKNAPSKDINDEGYMDKALPCRDIGDVADPEHVWRRRTELVVHAILRARECLVWHHGFWLLSANDALNADVLHHACDGATCNFEAPSPHLVPDLANAIDAEVLVKNPLNPRLSGILTLGSA